ncbi:MAG: signal peptidase I [Desulfovibrionales bacterium]
MTPRWLKLLKEYTEALIIAILLAFVIRSFVVQAFKIPSGSMLQTLQIGDHLLVNKFLYGIKIPFTNVLLMEFADPDFQDIIVFEFPEDPSKDFIKRVVGIPGDTIEIVNKEVYRNGEKISEPYVQYTDPSIKPIRDNLGPVKIPEDRYFVMGDNRDESYDSRFWGLVEREKILGKALIIYWSWEGLGQVRWNRIGDLIE